ncbi:hypothetical protein KM043_004276 [Ampulex compressa]|nr:hypothetical protein KM043_004276 [Ampulex compressa]
MLVHAARGMSTKVDAGIHGSLRECLPSAALVREGLRVEFTHRLWDKNRESASLPIRLFFRPSSMAEAAISITQEAASPGRSPVGRTSDSGRKTEAETRPAFLRSTINEEDDPRLLRGTRRDAAGPSSVPTLVPVVGPPPTSSTRENCATKEPSVGVAGRRVWARYRWAAEPFAKRRLPLWSTV